MSERDDAQANRPPDPAGTKPKVDPESLVPAPADPLIPPVIESTAFEDDSEHRMLPERIAAAGAVGRVATGDTAPHAPRFQFLFGALAALGFAAVATIVALAMYGGGSDGPRGPSWSPWRPTGDGANAAEQIAQHIGREYHLAGGEQLVLVTGGPLEVADLPLTIALRKAAEQGGDISLVDGKGILYRLCGLGPKCAIKKGKPSVERHLLLRREALELALYSFRYTDVDNVVVFMPPRPGQDPTQALFFRRRDVGLELDRPLAATLTRTAPLPRTVTRSPDTPLVDRVTQPRLFQFSLTQANQDNRAFLVLEPLAAAPK